MVTPSTPDLKTLTAGLAAVFTENGSTGELAAVVDREPREMGTFPSESVTCRFRDGTERHLFCKYGRSDGHACYGHRGGIVREIAAYRHVLSGAAVSSARFYGSYVEAGNGAPWLVIEDLDGAERLTKVTQGTPVVLAAKWLASFHAANEAPAAELGDILALYDRAYYDGWIQRTLKFTEGRISGLRELSERADRFLDDLLALPVTVIHGEFYPRNILIRGATVYPVDWESAAIAPPEIDLAALTEGWPADVVEQSVQEYVGRRWGLGAAPGDLERRLDLARLYLHYRWLGDRPSWTRHPAARPRVDLLRETAARLGLVGASTGSQ